MTTPNRVVRVTPRNYRKLLDDIESRHEQGEELSQQDFALYTHLKKLATTKLIYFTLYCDDSYIADPCHVLIAEKLDQITNGTFNKKGLAINMPAQHGKSRLASQCFPAFTLGCYANKRIMLTSYGASLAEFHSRKARDLIDSKSFAELFPDVRTRKDVHSNEYWEVDEAQGYMAAIGVGGAATGKGATIAILDDIIKDAEEASSKATLEKHWDWYNSVLRGRVASDGYMIIVATRWNELDLAGKVLEHDRDNWELLRLPELAENQTERDFANKRLFLSVGLPDPLNRKEGEALCPSRYPREERERLKDSLNKTVSGRIVWMTQYQQLPVAIEGIEYKREWFRIANSAPLATSYVRAWDKAGTAGSGKYSCGVLMCYIRDPLSPDTLNSGMVYVLHVVRGQWSALEREKVILETARMDVAKYGIGVKIFIEQEPASGGKESAETTIRNLIGFFVEAAKPVGDKLDRSRPFRVQVENGNVLLLQGEWNEAYIDEFIAFPNGRYTDQVDASSIAFMHLNIGGQPFNAKAAGDRPNIDNAVTQLPPILGVPSREDLLRRMEQFQHPTKDGKRIVIQPSPYKVAYPPVKVNPLTKVLPR